MRGAIAQRVVVTFNLVHFGAAQRSAIVRGRRRIALFMIKGAATCAREIIVRA